ncbi:putative glutathione S-transferase [Chytriomyces cf. hyalinus JEL632]|nr:putative glutathione S-transferase [Chytriomyces cf. hyalinus JEL632]
MKLHVFNQNFSSWSMRPLLVVKKLQLPVTISAYNLADAAHVAKVKAEVNATGFLPALEVDFPGSGKATVIPDSLAIIETLNDLFPNAQIWPQDVCTRAKARSLAAEMHSSYQHVRTAMPCNLRTQTLAEIQRILHVWETARAETIATLGSKKDDGWLFGEFSGADAMYFPVVTRFVSYSVEISGSFPLAKKYMERVLQDGAVKGMYATGFNEEWVIEKYDKVYVGGRRVNVTA